MPWKGTWDGSTSYTQYDVVRATDNAVYSCSMPNTGNDPAHGASPTYWNLMLQGIPPGGAAGAFLQKQSDTDYDIDWSINMSGTIPSGRLTLTSGVPFLTTDVLAATSIIYTPAVGAYIPLFDGSSSWINAKFSELSQALSDTTKSPAAAAANTCYDLFVWSDSGTIRCTRGPAWSSTTSRGTGAGTTELQMQDGFYLNKNAITNGPAALKGTYVGTICTDGSAKLNMMFAPTAASGGSANRLDVWNAYNQQEVVSSNTDSTTNWNYSSATWRAKNGSASNGTSFVVGLAKDAFDAINNWTCDQSSQNTYGVGFGLDSTSTLHSLCPTHWSRVAATGKTTGGESSFSMIPAIGAHTLYPLEISQASGTTTWQNNTTIVSLPLVSRFVFRFRM